MSPHAELAEAERAHAEILADLERAQWERAAAFARYDPNDLRRTALRPIVTATRRVSSLSRLAREASERVERARQALEGSHVGGHP